MAACWRVCYKGEPVLRCAVCKCLVHKVERMVGPAAPRYPTTPELHVVPSAQASIRPEAVPF